jgi:hypothetical protein
VGEVGIQSPAQALIEALGTIDVGDRDDDHFEFRLDAADVRRFGCMFVDHWELRRLYLAWRAHGFIVAVIGHDQ